jgi:hypothetical protein
MPESRVVTGERERGGDKRLDEEEESSEDKSDVEVEGLAEDRTPSSSNGHSNATENREP